MEAVVAEDLSKIYGNGVKALSNVFLKVRSGVIFSLLGRNGAGKTTFLRIMATQLMPTSGRGYVLGYDVVSEAEKVRELIAIIPQEARPMYLLTVKEHIKYFLMMRGFPKWEASRKTIEIIQELGLEEYQDTLCMKLSGGLKRKVLVAMAMATEAEVLFLDEPTTGLDPVSRRQVWDIIRKASKKGQTVFLTTHYMDEAEKISDEVALINLGKLIISGTIEYLRESLPYKMRVEIPLENMRNEDVFKNYGKTVKVGNKLWIYVEDDEKSRELYNYCLSKNIPVFFSKISLEDVFIEMVKRNEACEAT
ncbi:MAG: ABC transporter ATP-binding protein [Nitrososphaerota archaeon]|nr:ABC transporter ATP-binding protein [Candidatus Geocrenenecus dongiae]